MDSDCHQHATAIRCFCTAMDFLHFSILACWKPPCVAIASIMLLNSSRRSRSPVSTHLFRNQHWKCHSTISSGIKTLARCNFCCCCYMGGHLPSTALCFLAYFHPSSRITSTWGGAVPGMAFPLNPCGPTDYWGLIFRHVFPAHLQSVLIKFQVYLAILPAVCNLITATALLRQLEAGTDEWNE